MILLVIAALPSQEATAHAWNIPYFLPVPFWLYAYASAGALIISFAILSFVSGTQQSRGIIPTSSGRYVLRVPSSLLTISQIASGALLGLSILAGALGTPNPFQNISMTGFWVWFYLGSLYISAIVGDMYAFANPFAALLQLAANYEPKFNHGLFRYDQRFAYYPALTVYIGLIALELFGVGLPREVSFFLGAYLAYALVGALCFGRDAWLKYFDTFGLLCRLCALLAPFAWSRMSDSETYIRLRNPLTKIAGSGTQHSSIVIFLSFMLASTAYDGLHDTAPWSAFFWRHIYPYMINVLPLLKGDYALASQIFVAWQWATFALTGTVYYVLFRGCCALSVIGTHSSINGGMFARQSCLVLLPIAFFYNLCHYFTLFLNQNRQILTLMSDPFGRGWNLLRLTFASDPAMQPFINMSYIWHIQIFLILLGHVLGVYFAHAITLRKDSLKKNAIVSQLPLLVLTIALTISGLWILSLPLA